MDITEEFETFSSLKLNLQKSEACWIGASGFNSNTSTNCIWVSLVNDKIRTLGTYINYNKQLADQYNFVKSPLTQENFKYLEVARATTSRKNSSLESISISIIKNCAYLHNETLLIEIC